MRIVQTIRAVPSQSNSKPPELLLQIEAASKIPLIPLISLISRIQRKGPVSIMVQRDDMTFLSPYERDHKLAFDEAQKIRHDYENMRALNKKSIKSSPFRLGSYLLWKVFRSFRSVFSSDRFVFLRVKGKGVWKLNTHAAWALEEGKAMDKLIKYKF